MKTQSDKEAIISAREFWNKEFGEYPQTDADKLAVAMMTKYSKYASQQKEAEAVGLQDVLFFAEYFRNNFDYYDCNANGNVYKWSDLSKRSQPAMSMKQIFEYWKTL